MTDGTKRPPSASGWFGHECPDGPLRLIEVPFDATSSGQRVARLGPEAMRRASHQVEWSLPPAQCPIQQGLSVVQLDLKQSNDEASQAMQTLRRAQDQGGETERAQQTVEAACHHVDTLLGEALQEAWAQNCAVLVVGGDHGSVYAGMHEALGRWPELGILQIDAHADRRTAYEDIAASHASVMHRVRTAHPQTPLTQVGLRDMHPTERARMDADPATTPFYDEDLVQQQFLGMPWAEQARAIIASLPPQVWITFDVDGLDPTLCPNTGTPVPGGLSFYQACDLIERIKTSGRQLVGADLCEVAGEPWDANVGSRLVYRLLAALL